MQGSEMRAMVCNEYGPPDRLAVQDVETPNFRPDEVRIRVRTAGVNFPDTLIIQGKYQLKPPLPFIPGFEVAGEITAIGSQVSTHSIGDRVMALTSSGYGAFAEQAVAKAHEVVCVPDEIDDITAMALYTAYGTAYHALVQRGQIRPGETLVVLGASGGVGLAAVEIGVALGSRVIAVGRSLDKLRIAREKGATAILSYSEGDLRHRIKELTDGKGADICLDTLGGDAFDAMSRAMNWNGRLLVIGFTSGVIPRLAVNLLLLKGYQVIGVYWGSFVSRSPEINAANFEVLAHMHQQGQIRPYVSKTYPLEQVGDALRDLSSRNTIGKLVITVAPGSEIGT
jgi:NADPH2:quinone reductase